MTSLCKFLISQVRLSVPKLLFNIQKAFCLHCIIIVQKSLSGSIQADGGYIQRSEIAPAGQHATGILHRRHSISTSDGLLHRYSGPGSANGADWLPLTKSISQSQQHLGQIQNHTKPSINGHHVEGSSTDRHGSTNILPFTPHAQTTSYDERSNFAMPTTCNLATGGITSASQSLDSDQPCRVHEQAPGVYNSQTNHLSSVHRSARGLPGVKAISVRKHHSSSKAFTSAGNGITIAGLKVAKAKKVLSKAHHTKSLTGHHGIVSKRVSSLHGWCLCS